MERSLKKLRDLGYISYTGKIAPKSKNIPIYRINLNHGLSGGDKRLTTDIHDSNHGHLGNLTTPSEGIWIDNILKDNKKDNALSFNFSKTSKFNPENQDDAHDKKMIEYKKIIEERKRNL